jgi:hypothetical protein
MAASEKSKVEKGWACRYVFAIFSRKTNKMIYWLIICSIYFFIAGMFFKEEWDSEDSFFLKIAIFLGSIFWLLLFLLGCCLWLIVNFCIPHKAKESK